MRGLEVPAMVPLVVHDDDKARDAREEGDVVQCGVRVCALLLLLG